MEVPEKKAVLILLSAKWPTLWKKKELKQKLYSSEISLCQTVPPVENAEKPANVYSMILPMNWWKKQKLPMALSSALRFTTLIQAADF